MVLITYCYNFVFENNKLQLDSDLVENSNTVLL